MKKLFVVDADEKFQTLIKSICKKGAMELHLFKSAMEVLPKIESENPDLIFVNLELPDIDDFVMYDLMKQADMKPPIPVLITYEEKSEKYLHQYKRMKFKPEGYFKKPISDTNITALLARYLGDASISIGSREKKKDEPSKGENNDIYIDVEGFSTDEEELIFKEVFAETEFGQEPLTQVSTEEQPFTVDEPDLTKTQKKSQAGIEVKEYEKKLKELEKEKIDLVKQTEQLTDKLTNKERELEEKDQELAKKIKELENEKKQIEAANKDELEAQENLNKELQQEINRYKNKNEQLGELFHKAVSLTQKDDKS